MAHRNARLTVHGRTVLIERVLSGRPVAHVAAELGISRATGYKWWARYRAEGPTGLIDRPSHAHHIPSRTTPEAEARVLALRRERKLGPHRIAPLTGLPASTVHAVLVRHGLSRLAWMDRPTGQLIRRYERDRPGELVHVDVKKLGRLRDGGGWRAHGRDSIEHRRARYGTRVGYDYIHAAIDDHTRLAYAEIHPDEQATTCAAFLRRATTFFHDHGITHIERVMTDNALAYRRSRAWREALAEIGAQARFTRRYRPQTNGKAERFNRTLAEEWAYQRPFTSNDDRAAALPTWLHTYNHHRCHTAIGGNPPITRVNNAAGSYS
ncbi:transposase IS481 family protein [Pseudonocardia sediminis]|uniref:Transposase IS481 family protein n=1 Tax=Pseudonocardia sediminis TaxID=1397368 RepID=A0A4Q7UVK8_PSEST|nr:IS481 family transposase [Pseudonocardia sediminis]RZT84978.1 transposase IS481 family protein [Pseudonocardia sediminis]RZT85042.1 transposase IS481 family protein [Pseudonocardia sediminis]RZT88867.1 transposase IS481 family protein [Pseudonocardia sediminis]